MILKPTRNGKITLLFTDVAKSAGVANFDHRTVFAMISFSGKCPKLQHRIGEQPNNAQVSLASCAVFPEPSVIAYTKNGRR